MASEIGVSVSYKWNKPVKFQHIHLPLLVIWSLKNQCIISSYEELIPNLHLSRSKNANLRKKNLTKSLNKVISLDDFYYFLQGKPINLSQNDSKKLAKYIFSDHSDLRENQPVIQWSLILTIIKASINQLLDDLDNPSAINSWRCLLEKNKKFLREIEEEKSSFIEKEEFVSITLMSKTYSLTEEEINFVTINTFNREESLKRSAIMLDRIRILQCMYGLQGNP